MRWSTVGFQGRKKERNRGETKGAGKASRARGGSGGSGSVVVYSGDGWGEEETERVVEKQGGGRSVVLVKVSVTVFGGDVAVGDDVVTTLCRWLNKRRR